jgi:hypothetical protein
MRGWTLQELLAPRYIEFYASDWSLIGEKLYSDGPLHRILFKITGIKEVVVDQSAAIGGCSKASRMSWAASRETSSEEGPFEAGYLADAPQPFQGSGKIVSSPESGSAGVLKRSFSMTNHGLSITPRFGFRRSDDGVHSNCWAMLDNVAIRDAGQTPSVGLHIKLHDGQFYALDPKKEIVCSWKITDSLFLGKEIVIDSGDTLHEIEYSFADDLAGPYRKLLVPQQEDVHHF